MQSDSKKTFAKWLKIIFGAILIFAAIGILTFSKKLNQNDQVTATREKVFNTIKTRFIDVRRIKITIPDGSFNIKKIDNSWNVQERENYPAANYRINLLASQLSLLERGELISSDPSQFDNYGVGEPVEFGFGTIIEFFDSQDQLIAASHVGQKDNKIYVRKLGDVNVYRAVGDLIKIDEITAWLDYELLSLKSEDIKSVQGEIIGFDKFRVKRNNDGQFAIDDRSNGTIEKFAMALKDMKLIDVAPKSRIKVDPTAINIFELNDGTMIECKLFKQNGIYWLQLRAVNKGTDVGTALNLKASDWVFALDPESAKNMFRTKKFLLNPT